jgi:hypothetical protein
MPEEHVEADVDVGLVRDRRRHCEVPGALESPCDEASRQLRVVSEAAGCVVVQDRDPSRQEYPPAGRRRKVRLSSLPWPQKIARPQQLRAETAPDVDLSDQQPLDDQ